MFPNHTLNSLLYALFFALLNQYKHPMSIKNIANHDKKNGISSPIIYVYIYKESYISYIFFLSLQILKYVYLLN